MTQPPQLKLSGVVLDSPDPRALAGFYHQLLGWEMKYVDPTWVMLKSPEGGAGLSFQLEPEFVRPVWPSTRTDQQMMVHLDIGVDDMEAAGAHAIASGAVLAEFQLQKEVRVYLDPAGHPFCLFPIG